MQRPNKSLAVPLGRHFLRNASLAGGVVLDDRLGDGLVVDRADQTLHQERAVLAAGRGQPLDQILVAGEQPVSTIEAGAGGSAASASGRTSVIPAWTSIGAC